MKLGTNPAEQRRIRAPRETVRTGPTRYRRVLRTGLTVELADLPTTMQLADLVPMARQLCDRAMDDFIAASEARGRPTRCRRRCDACCHYVVGLSVCEAAALANWVGSLPQRTRGVIHQRLTDAAGPIVEVLGPLSQAGEARPTPEVMAQMARIPPRPCPLLHEGLCSIYLQRPLACREHVALADHRPCHRAGGAAAELEASVLQALVKATARIEGRSPEIVPLPLALHWARKFDRRLDRSYPAKAMLDAVLDELDTQLPSDWIGQP